LPASRIHYIIVVVFSIGSQCKGGEGDFSSPFSFIRRNFLENDILFPGKMSGKNFVNQFKNTRRQSRLQSGKKGRNAASGMKKPLAGRRPWGKARPEKA
jgi:hypothetical protein